MSTDTALPNKAELALIRSRIYKLFAVAFGDPDEGFIVALKDGFFAKALESELDQLANELGIPRASERDSQRNEQIHFTEQLREEFTKIFVHPGAASQPYETEYTASHEFMKANQMADIMGFYRAYGLDLSSENHDRADSIVAELEFMHFIYMKEAAARTKYFGHIDLTVETEKKFLGEHIGRWIGTFAEQVRSAYPESPYGILLGLLNKFIQNEITRFDVKPAPLPPRWNNDHKKEEVGLCEQECPVQES